jgi:uncharacterized protein (TIGR03437 family)
MSLRPWLLFIGTTFNASAQFFNLVTNDDGSILLFSSALKMRGTDQYEWRKLFRVDSSGLQLLEQREKYAPWPGDFATSFFSLTGADISGDGSVVARTGVRTCIWPGSGCTVVAPKMETSITGLPGDEIVSVLNSISLSRNGRYAILCCDPQSTAAPRGLRDLYTGASRPLPIQSGTRVNTKHVVSSTGVVVLPQSSGSLRLVSLDDEVTLSVSSRPIAAAIDDQAIVVVYEGETTDGGSQLARVNILTGEETVVHRGRSQLRLIGLSNDGALVAFLANVDGVQQLFVLNSDGSGLKQLTRSDSPVSEAVLSGSGQVAFAVVAGIFLKIDCNTGEQTVLFNALQSIHSVNPGKGAVPVAGSAFCFRGTGFSSESYPSTGTPSPTEVAGVQLLIDGQPAPILALSQGNACIQVPWNLPAGAHHLTISNREASAFDGSPDHLFNLVEPRAKFVWLAPPANVEWAPYALATHEDFKDLVTPDSPGRAGEVVHFRMTGLGPVDPSVPDGEPAAESPSRVVVPPSCHFSDFQNGRIDADIVSAELSSVTTGYYQVSIRIPAESSLHFTGTLQLTCAPREDRVFVPVAK